MFREDWPEFWREGVAPLKDATRDIPRGVRGARWTKISTELVSREALEEGNERYDIVYEDGQESVIVLKVLGKKEIRAYAELTQKKRSTFPLIFCRFYFGNMLM